MYLYDSGCKTIKNKKIINSGLSLDLLCCRKNKNSKLHLESYMPRESETISYNAILFSLQYYPNSCCRQVGNSP